MCGVFFTLQRHEIRFLFCFFTWLHIVQATEEVNTVNSLLLLAAEERKEWEDQEEAEGGDRLEKG